MRGGNVPIDLVQNAKVCLVVKISTDHYFVLTCLRSSKKVQQLENFWTKETFVADNKVHSDNRCAEKQCHRGFSISTLLYVSLEGLRVPQGDLTT